MLHGSKYTAMTMMQINLVAYTGEKINFHILKIGRTI